MKNSSECRRQKMPGLCVLLLAVCLMSRTALAETRLELEEAQITGARELPKVLYIVPWKSTAPRLEPLPMSTLVEEELTPLDMEVFRREGRYLELLDKDVQP